MGMGQLLSKLTAIVGPLWAAWHLAMPDHFTSLTHTQANLTSLVKWKETLPCRPGSAPTCRVSITVLATPEKSLLKVKVQGGSRGVAPASQGGAGPLGSQAGLWQGNTGKLPPKPMCLLGHASPNGALGPGWGCSGKGISRRISAQRRVTWNLPWVQQ